MREQAIIVGGGVAGLATGSYLRMNGYRTTLLEQAAGLGGVSAAWRRKGYTFDGATEWLPGSAPHLNLHRSLAEIVDFSRLEINYFEQFSRIEWNDKVLRVFTDVERFEAELLELAPEDARPIREFTGAVARVARLVLPVDRAPELMGVREVLGGLRTNLPLLWFVRRWRNITIAEYAERFSNADLRQLFKLIFPRHEFFSVLGLIFALGWMCMRAAGHPVGGSFRFIGLAEERYRQLGGELRLRARVARVIEEDGRARGVVLDDGSELRADLVVSTGDLWTALFDLLGGRRVPPRVQELTESAALFPGTLQVSLGVDRLFEGEAHKYVLRFAEPRRYGDDAEISFAIAKLSILDPSLAPPGKTAIVAHLRTTDWAYWQRLRETDRETYKREKQRLADDVIELLERRFGDVRDRVEVVDVATPATYVRYTGIWQGSYQGWAPTPRLIGRFLPRTLPGLGDFYLAGQWVEPGGGLPKAVLSARNVAQLICRDDGKPFVTTVAGRA